MNDDIIINDLIKSAIQFITAVGPKLESYVITHYLRCSGVKNDYNFEKLFKENITESNLMKLQQDLLLPFEGFTENEWNKGLNSLFSQ